MAVRLIATKDVGKDTVRSAASRGDHVSTPPEPGTDSPVREQHGPTGTRRSRVAAVLILSVFFVTTLLTGWFGILDFSEALTFPGRITGAVLIAVSLTTLVGAAAVLDHWFWHSFTYSGMIALIAAFAGLLTNAMLLVETVKDGDSVFFRALFSVLTASSAWAVFAVWRTSVVIPAPKRVATALIVSSVLAIGNFGYQNLYQPSQRQARPIIKLSMGKPVLSQNRNAFAVPVDITLENHGDVGFYVLGTEIHAMGERVPLSSKDRLRQQWRADAEQWAKFQENPLSRREIHQPGELVEAQPWIPSGGWIEANDSFATRVVVQMPVDTPYDQLAFYASATFARKDRLNLKGPLAFTGYSWDGGQVPLWMSQNNFDSLIYRARVHENNAIDERTRDPRYVTVYWEFGTHGAAIAAVIARTGEKETKPDLVNRYGIVDSRTGPIEQTLWDIKGRR